MTQHSSTPSGAAMPAQHGSGNKPLHGAEHPDPKYKGNALMARHRITVKYRRDPRFPMRPDEEDAIGFATHEAATAFAKRLAHRPDVVSWKYTGPDAPLKEDQFEGI